MREKQDKILAEALKIVPFDGWGREILHQAAEKAGFDANYADIAFKAGAIEAVEYFLQKIDTETYARIDEALLHAMKIRERISYIIETRLAVMGQNKAAVRKTVQFLAMPQNICTASKLLWDMADRAWYAAGDKATDFNYYTKRTTLMAVYSSTLLFWLEDTSENSSATKEFLARRIENVMQIESVKQRVREFVSD